MAARWTDQRLQKLCRELQSLLRLSDWKVTARFVDTYDDLEPDSHANIDYNINAKTAAMKVIRPTHYVCSAAEPAEMDVVDSTAHELLHLHFAPLEEGLPEGVTISQLAIEQAIESIAGGISALWRSRKRN